MQEAASYLRYLFARRSHCDRGAAQSAIMFIKLAGMR